MSSTDNHADQRLAAEVLELGQSLFEIMLEYKAGSDSEKEDNDSEAQEETLDHLLQSAKDEFFLALQLVYGLSKT